MFLLLTNKVQWNTNMFSYLNLISRVTWFCHQSLLNILQAISKLPIRTESPSVLVLNGCTLGHKPFVKKSSVSKFNVLQDVAIKICKSLFAHIWILQVSASCETFLNFNENENDILRLNDFLDFSYITFTVIFIIYFNLLCFDSN